ncbi:MAG: PIN domain-containing protein [Dehalococcoidia bacterium]|nr:PIN domain-containing protein [Dehalococcoidia bacterium]
MLAVDTNVLLYAANADSELHRPCLRRLEAWRRDPTPTFLTWNVCYEFLTNATNTRVFPVPWQAQQAMSFLQALLASPGFTLLTATGRHEAVLAQTLAELPGLRGGVLHDLHTAVLMREHGISQICTNDQDFHRFPFLTVIDPLE